MGAQPSAEAAALIEQLLGRTTFQRDRGSATCAVSGGADSLALLVLAVEAGLDVTAVHVDHGLRAGSSAEAEVVATAAARWGARFRAERVHLADGPNLEARARAARYAVLPPEVLTGHTADDQAETIVLNLLRGSGIGGLAGMRPSPRRPLLGLRRSETHALVALVGLDVVVDPSNDDPRHRRNRVRHDVLPLLDAVADRDLTEILVRQADLLRSDDDLLHALAEGLDPTDGPALAAAPLPLARRAVRRWLTPALAGYPPDAATVARVLAVARGEVRACELPGGTRVERTARRLRLSPPARPASVDEGSEQYTPAFVEAGAPPPDRTEGDA